RLADEPERAGRRLVERAGQLADQARAPAARLADQRDKLAAPDQHLAPGRLQPSQRVLLVGQRVVEGLAGLRGALAEHGLGPRGPGYDPGWAAGLGSNQPTVRLSGAR